MKTVLLAATLLTLPLAAHAQETAVSCELACSHIAECQVNDYASCLGVCRQKATPEQMREILASSCEQLLGAAKAEAQKAAEPTCSTACRHIVECGLNDFDTCMAKCKVPKADLEKIMRSSCDQLGGSGGGASGGAGAPCQGGDGTCQGINTCCGPNGPAAYGQRGVCQSVAVCSMPRH